MTGLLAVVSRDDISGPLLGPGGFAVAFLVGMVSFFSPCVLPLLPGYLSFVSGLSGEEIETAGARRRTVLGTLLFVAGFAAMYTALGATGGIIGRFLVEHVEVIMRVAGVIVVVMGIAFMAPRLFPFLEREGRPLLRHAKPGLAGAFPLGVAFAAGWTACVGPGLGVMISLAADSGSVGRGALLLLFFSLGFGVWFILASLGLRRALRASAWIRQRARTIQAVGGAFMVVIGVLLIVDRWDALMAPLRRWIDTFQPPV